jgi:ABC-type sugar transport system permease subunit
MGAMIAVGARVAAFTTILLAAQTIPRGPQARWTGPRAGAYRVTLPLLRPVLVATVLNLIYVFNSFPIVWTLNDRNPGFAHDTMITFMYKIAFKSALRDVGLAAALGVVNVLLILLAVVAYLRVLRGREEPV